mgnify:CR=1 FL=1
MDDDIQTDFEIMKNAKGTCLQDMHFASDQIGSVQIKIIQSSPHTYGSHKYTSTFK